MHRIKQFAFQKENRFYRIIAMTVMLAVLVCLFTLPAAAQNTYRITDGNRVMIYTTDATDPAQVLDEAGLELGKDDTYTTQSGGTYSEIYVKRVQMVTIDNGGQIIRTGSYGETVEELLTRLNLSYTENDVISAELSEEVYNGMDITIDRIQYVTETYARSIPYETAYITDETLAEGETRIVTQGQDGEMLCTAEVVYENGRETRRSLKMSEMTIAPVDEVIAVGTAPRAEEVSGELTIGDGVIVTAEGDILTYTGTMSVVATAYTCEGVSNPSPTATGTVARVGAIAVDPTVIPYGTRMFIVSDDGQYIYGVATAEDTGHPDYITGRRIDLYMDTNAERVQFGARNCTIYFLGQ